MKSRNALMDAAYDDQVYVDDRTIDSHIKRLRKKFKVVGDALDMIETLYGVGYRFKESCERRRDPFMDATTPADIPLRSPRRRRMRRLRLLTRVRAMWRLLVQRASSSLTRRIVVLNLAGLVALLVGFLYLNRFPPRASSRPASRAS